MFAPYNDFHHRNFWKIDGIIIEMEILNRELDPNMQIHVNKRVSISVKHKCYQNEEARDRISHRHTILV